jgi:hypothetical protein
VKLALAAFLALSAAWSRPAAAEAPLVDDAVMRGPALPARLVPTPRSFWQVGLGVEHFGTGFEGGNYLGALALTYRYRSFAPNLLLLAKPSIGTGSYEESRFALGLGLRSYVRVLDVDVSYGVSMQGELRFEDHFWLLHATPLELGAVVYRRRTLDVELFVGVRGALSGHLIDSFLLDPNGFQNESAQAALSRATGSDRFHGFLRVVVSRRLD